MAYALCSRCGKRLWWSGTKGSKLENWKSGCCNAPMQRIHTEPQPDAGVSVMATVRPHSTSLAAQFFPERFPHGCSERPIRCKIELLPDGRIDPRRGLLYHYRDTGMVDGEWRVLDSIDHRADREPYHFLVLETDYQRLLAKQGKTKIRNENEGLAKEAAS